MRRFVRVFVFCLGIAIAATAAHEAAAQAIGAGSDTPKVELFGGYDYLRANIVVSGTPVNLNGGSGSLAYNVYHWLGLVADVGAYHQGGITASRFSLSLTTYQFGPRVTLRRWRRLTPFGQALFGGGHATGTLYTTSLGGGLPPVGASNAFVLTAGAGADWRLSGGWGVRLVQAEYVRSQFQNAGHGNEQNNYRIGAGVVFNFGER